MLGSTRGDAFSNGCNCDYLGLLMTVEATIKSLVTQHVTEQGISAVGLVCKVGGDMFKMGLNSSDVDQLIPTIDEMVRNNEIIEIEFTTNDSRVKSVYLPPGSIIAIKKS